MHAGDHAIQEFGTHEQQAVLVVDGAPRLRGNRSRIVLLANLLRDMDGRPALAIVAETLAPRAVRALEWTPPGAGTLFRVEAFGPGVVEGATIDVTDVPIARPIAVPYSGVVRFAATVRNPINARADVALALFYEPRE